jgi:hypothetical protein
VLGDLWGWAQRFFGPVAQWIWRVLSFLVLAAVFFFVGLFRMSNWVFTFRLFWLFFVMAWVSTAVLVANYETVSDTLRPAFQTIDDIIFRGIWPIINDIQAFLWKPYCKAFNFTFEIVWCIFRIILKAIRLIVKCLSSIGFDLSDPDDTSACDSGPIDDAFIDGYLLGTEWVDLINPSARSFILKGMPVMVRGNPTTKERQDAVLQRLLHHIDE